jgi:putative copper resistance protein D
VEEIMVATFVTHGSLADDQLPPLTLHTAFTVWEFAPAVTVLVAVAAAVYLLGVFRVRRDHPARPWSLLRTASFMAGLGVIVIATQSSIGAYDDVLFSMHMWQHLLLLMVAPPFLLAGQPVTLLLHASRNPLHTWVKRAVRSRIADVVTFPLVGVALYVGVVVGTHLTGFMNVTLTHPLVHIAEHGLYLVAGYLYFLPLIGREPIRWRLSYPAQLFLFIVAMPVDTFTGVVLLETNHAIFPAYAGRRNWGPSLVDDLHVGGAVMWIGGDGIMVLLIVLLFALVVRKRVQFDAGRWLEAARAQRFSELATSASTADARDATTTDDDDQQLAAYNEYLARLNDGHGSPAGSAS